MPYSAGPNIAARPNLVFEYDTGDVQNSYKGIPVVNCATDLTSGYNVTVTEVTDGSIPPPFGGMRVYKFVTANNYNLYRQGGYYDGGGFAGSNPRPLILGRTSPSNFTTVGTGKYRFGMYVRGDASNSAGAGLAIDIGDRNAVSTTVGTSSTWQLIQTNDSAGINDSSYPYDFFDIGADFNMTFYVAGYGIWRNIGTVDNLPALQAYPQGTQYITYGQTRSVTQGLLDVSGQGNSINLANVSFNSSAQMVFDGTDDLITLGNVNQYFAPQVGGVSTETVFLITPGASGNDGPLFENYRYNLWYVYASDNINLYTRTGPPTYASYTFSVSLQSNIVCRTKGLYNHLVSVYETISGGTGKVSLYINGQAAGTSTGLEMGNYPLFDPMIGQSYHGGYGTYRLNGQVPITRIYNYALSASEVLRNYNQLKGRFNLP